MDSVFYALDKQYKSWLGIFINHQVIKDQVKYDKIYHLVAVDIYRNVLRYLLYRIYYTALSFL